MKHAWKLFSFLLFMYLSGHAVGADPLKAFTKPVIADPLRSAMEKKGYVAIQMAKFEEDGCFYVDCKFGEETWRMMVDTGAESSSLDMGLVKKLGLKKGEEVKTVGIEGVRTGFMTSVRGIMIGEFDSRTVANSLSLAAVDFTVMNTVDAKPKERRIDGLLGHSALKLNSAVIDYSTATLYLRSPLKSLWPEIEGRWIATAGQENGRERKLDPGSPLRLEFKENRFHLRDKVIDITFGLHIKPGKDYHIAGFFDPDEEKAKELNYSAYGILKVSEGRLTLCVCLDPLAAKGLPNEFKAPADSGRLLLEFQREK